MSMTAEEKLQRKQELEKELLRVEQDLRREQDNSELKGDIFEEVLKQIIRTTVEELSTDTRMKRIEDYPVVLHVCHISELLGISEAGAYQLARMDGCPRFINGERRITLPRDLFWEWYQNTALENAKHRYTAKQLRR